MPLPCCSKANASDPSKKPQANGSSPPQFSDGKTLNDIHLKQLRAKDRSEIQTIRDWADYVEQEVQRAVELSTKREDTFNDDGMDLSEKQELLEELEKQCKEVAAHWREKEAAWNEMTEFIKKELDLDQNNPEKWTCRWRKYGEQRQEVETNLLFRIKNGSEDGENIIKKITAPVGAKGIDIEKFDSCRTAV